MVLITVPVVVANPCHRKRQGVFVTALRHEVEIVVNAEQRFGTACVTGICVEDATGLVLVEHADPVGFLARELARTEVVILARAISFFVNDTR